MNRPKCCVLCNFYNLRCQKPKMMKCTYYDENEQRIKFNITKLDKGGDLEILGRIINNGENE